MLADSSLGFKGDEAVMIFHLPSIGDVRALTFDYYFEANFDGQLKVMLRLNGTFHSTLKTYTHLPSRANTWVTECMELRSLVASSFDIEIRFVAVRGTQITSDVGIDNVKLAEHCPHLISCNRVENNCGWNMTHISNLASWQFGGSTSTDETRGIRIRGSSSAGLVELFYQGRWYGVCDDSWDSYDATVACRWLGFSNPSNNYAGYGQSGNSSFILANLYCTSTENTLYNCSHAGLFYTEGCYSNEYAYLACYGTKNNIIWNINQPHFYLTTTQYNETWATVSSPKFDHAGGPYKFMFNYRKTGSEMLQNVAVQCTWRTLFPHL
ncbi:deleted in malignant brain tumors 1 protein-like [Dreissena polymorpha]|uniref:deleted in malignant brain tumors 1 protein-like n=1 Tax=Dreissena polymorpha TaxID=45954 RepID=UPI002264C40A|nr:deleted in malignant brain tumors 1 protein-like [Dreissena polymorpha]